MDEKMLLCIDFDNSIVNGHFHHALMNDETIAAHIDSMTGQGKKAGVIVKRGDDFYHRGTERIDRNLSHSSHFNKVLSGLLANKETGLKNGPEMLQCIRQALQKGHKVAITSYTLFPEVVTPTLRAMGLSENEIKQIAVIGGFPEGGPNSKLYGKKEHINAAVDSFQEQDNGVKIKDENIVLVDDDVSNVNNAKMHGHKGILVPKHANPDLRQYNYIKEIRDIFSAQELKTTASNNVVNASPSFNYPRYNPAQFGIRNFGNTDSHQYTNQNQVRNPISENDLQILSVMTGVEYRNELVKWRVENGVVSFGPIDSNLNAIMRSLKEKIQEKGITVNQSDVNGHNKIQFEMPAAQIKDLVTQYKGIKEQLSNADSVDSVIKILRENKDKLISSSIESSRSHLRELMSPDGKIDRWDHQIKVIQEIREKGDSEYIISRDYGLREKIEGLILKEKSELIDKEKREIGPQSEKSVVVNLESNPLPSSSIRNNPNFLNKSPEKPLSSNSYFNVNQSNNQIYLELEQKINQAQSFNGVIHVLNENKDTIKNYNIDLDKVIKSIEILRDGTQSNNDNVNINHLFGIQKKVRELESKENNIKENISSLKREYSTIRGGNSGGMLNSLRALVKSKEDPVSIAAIKRNEQIEILARMVQEASSSPKNQIETDGYQYLCYQAIRNEIKSEDNKLKSALEILCEKKMSDFEKKYENQSNFKEYIENKDNKNGVVNKSKEIRDEIWLRNDNRSEKHQNTKMR